MSQLQKRKELMHKAKQTTYIRPLVDEALVQKHLQSTVDRTIETSIEIKEKSHAYQKIQGLSTEEMLNLLAKQFDEKKKDELFESCKQTVLESIIKPFGLGALLFSGHDKDGGNVTTLHNFEKGVVATEQDSRRYNEYKNKSFDRKNYEGKEFRQKRKEFLNSERPLTDAYTGKEIPKDGRSHLDHVVSAHEIHQDSKNHLYMSEDERTSMAIDDKNLAMTNSSLNQSKSDQEMEEFLERQKRGEAQKNEERYGIDREAALKCDQEARKYIKHTQMKQQIKKQGKELVSTSACEGGKMGIQQALGTMLYDFTEAAVKEIKEFLKYDVKHIKDEGIIKKLKDRLSRIAHKIISKWQDYLHVFKEGFLSGVLSNIITFIINTFMTTLKSFTRIIREGIFIFIKAAKMLVSPPPGMSKPMVYDAALKLIAGSVVTTVGILGAEALSKALGPIPFADLMANIIVGLLAGFAGCSVVYLLDKVDIFKVNTEAKHQYIVEQLENYEEEAVKSADYYYEKAMKSAKLITT